MKKLIAVFILGLSLVVVPSVSAIEEMSDAVMKKTTGQASVSVRVDNVVMEEVRLSILYVDDDGVTGALDDGAGIRIKSTINTQTFRAIFDGTDRGGYLHREYGTFLRRELTNDAKPHWAGLSTGGDIPFTEQTVGTSKKLKLHSYMKAFNNRAAGLAEIKKAYDRLSSLGLTYSNENSDTNISAVMAATGMEEYEASSVYSAANNYAMVLDDNSLADEIGTKVYYSNTSVSGVELTLPTLETKVNFGTVSLEVETGGSSYNDGAEFINISYADSVSATLGGHIEISTNR